MTVVTPVMIKSFFYFVLEFDKCDTQTFIRFNFRALDKWKQTGVNITITSRFI